MNETPAPDNTDLDVHDILSRAARSRQGLLDALSGVSDDAFGREPPGEWGAARLLRHVVWVEAYWTLLLRALRDAAKPTLNLDPVTMEWLAREASLLAGTPPEPLPSPPPYPTRHAALEGLEASRSAFNEVVGSLRPADFQRRFSHPRRGESHLRFAVEHVIEHDWEHALQLAGIEA